MAVKQNTDRVTDLNSHKKEMGMLRMAVIDGCKFFDMSLFDFFH